jgi:hypothetical protein
MRLKVIQKENSALINHELTFYFSFLLIYGFNDYIAEGEGGRGRRGIGMVQKNMYGTIIPTQIRHLLCRHTIREYYRRRCSQFLRAYHPMAN